MSEKRKKNKKYLPKFKISVITDMRENHFAYRETVRKHWHTASRSEEDLYVHAVKKRERRYLEERATGANDGTPGKEKHRQTEEATVGQRGGVGIHKKLSALVQAEEQKKGKKPK